MIRIAQRCASNRARALGRLPRAPPVRKGDAEDVQIIVDIRLGADGRPTGTVRAVDRPDGRSFSGNLEFLALVENLYQVDTDPEDSDTDTETLP
jgi:hypothetical protein